MMDALKDQLGYGFYFLTGYFLAKSGLTDLLSRLIEDGFRDLAQRHKRRMVARDERLFSLVPRKEENINEH